MIIIYKEFFNVSFFKSDLIEKAHYLPQLLILFETYEIKYF